MCLYIYSEDGPIEILYISESIYLGRYGSSEVYVDILINNPSKTNQLNSFCVIYPNRFKKYKKTKNKLQFYNYGSFGNLSPSLYDDNHEVNLTYTLSGFKRDTKSKPNTLILEKPNPEDMSKPFVYEGIIPVDAENDKFILYDGLTDTCWVMLNEICMSVFKYSFVTPVGGNGKRWVRLFFNAKQVSTFPPHWIKKIILLLIDDLKSTYCIMGPYDLINMFRERLTIHAYVAERSKTKDPESKNLYDQHLRAAQHIKDKVIDKINQVGSTKINDFTLHIFPGRLRTLSSVYGYGRIYPNGTLPNFLPEDESLKSTASWARRVYDWSSNNLGNSGKEDSFSIFFTGAARHRIIRFLALLVVLFVIVNVTISSILTFTESRWTSNALTKIDNIYNFIFIKYPVLTFLLGISIIPLVRYLIPIGKRIWNFFQELFC